MAKFKVIYRETFRCSIEIEAETEADAEYKFVDVDWSTVDAHTEACTDRDFLEARKVGKKAGINDEDDETLSKAATAIFEMEVDDNGCATQMPI